jgi:hypothetical protein
MGNDGGESNLAPLSLDSDKEYLASLSFGSDEGYLAGMYFLARERSFQLKLHLAQVHGGTGPRRRRRFYGIESAPATLLTTRNWGPTTTVDRGLRREPCRVAWLNKPNQVRRGSKVGRRLIYGMKSAPATLSKTKNGRPTTTGKGSIIF